MFDLVYQVAPPLFEDLKKVRRQGGRQTSLILKFGEGAKEASL